MVEIDTGAGEIRGIVVQKRVQVYIGAVLLLGCVTSESCDNVVL
jgi:hypothetical protein